jgi:hypothetical protein
MAPIKIAPPTPTTTPMMIFFWFESRPESELSEEDPLKPGDSVASLASVLVNVVGTGVPSMVCVVVMVLTVGGLVVDGSLSSDALVVVVVGSVVVLSSPVEVGSSVVCVGSSVVVVEVSSSVDVGAGVDVGSSSVDVEVGSSVSVVDESLSVSVADVSVGVGRASVMSDTPVSVTCAL